jgi:hypothetical protein
VPARRSHRQQGQEEQPGQAGRWPLLTATWRDRSPAEVDASHARAALLRSGGWQAVESWLQAPASAEEIANQQALQAQLAADQAQLVDVFGD